MSSNPSTAKKKKKKKKEKEICSVKGNIKKKGRQALS
jgi:hypothetical protein